MTPLSRYLLVVVILLFTASVHAQDTTDTHTEPIITTTPVTTEKSSDGKGRKRYFPDHSPKKAMLYSAVLPGLGQVYNRKIWKVPILYAGVGVLVYLVIDNNKEFIKFRDAYRIRTDGDPNTQDDYVGVYSDLGLRNIRDFHRRNRDLSVMITGLLYLLNIADAFIDAHLINFDISEDLSFSVKPAAIYANNTAGAGIQLNINFKK